MPRIKVHSASLSLEKNPNLPQEKLSAGKLACFMNVGMSEEII